MVPRIKITASLVVHPFLYGGIINVQRRWGTEEVLRNLRFDNSWANRLRCETIEDDVKHFSRRTKKEAFRTFLSTLSVDSDMSRTWNIINAIARRARDMSRNINNNPSSQQVLDPALEV